MAIFPSEGSEGSRNDGERIVISGMSGLYPKSHHIKDFSDVLYNKVNPITSEGKLWNYNHPEVPQYVGSVPQLDRFDAQFFGVHYRLANSMDTMSRKMLEQTFQAIYDAGLSPEHISGKKVGVYVGTCISETEKASFYVASSRTGFGIAGCSKAMFANRISYWLNAKGPSVAVDEACCSSTAALEQAYQAMARGECDAAVVGGANLTLHPQSMVHYGRIVKLCFDGKTKSFDENGDGCVKSEAINVLFLQKAKDALRIYADVMYVKTEFISQKAESGPNYGFYRNPTVMGTFLKNFYQEAGVTPKAVEYVEAFGSAVPKEDKAELEAITEVFCQNRKDPLLVGSVMSNIGYAEAATGISAVTKVLLGYHKGEIAANLHCSNPLKEVPALQDGRIQIVTDHKPFRRTYTAVNSFSVTGCVGHVLLHGHYKPKDLSKYKTSLPHLVTISGRQETAVQYILDDLKSRPIDPEELALLHNIHKKKITGHLGRGFTILDTDPEQKTVSLSEACEYFDDVRRPLWFVYSGMGSQWAGMGTQLMRIPIFSAAIERCDKVLKPKGLDIVHIITSPDKTIFKNILHSFVGIAAVQIGLTDILRELGLVPDKIIGHSVGELGCAYADGCLTAEEMILSAYSRGLVSVQTPFIHGSMAAVGVGYQEIVKMVPPEIEVACHNSADSSTISGPSEVMREFVASLTAKGIFAKEVPCSNIAYHSRYIADAGPGLLKYLKEVIKVPKERSEKWVSTSVPQDRWDEPAAKYSSAEYHTNNLLNPVLFEETSALIPYNAVLVEVAPHGLLQAILKRALPATCKNLALTRRGHPDNPLLVLETIGKLFMEGHNPKVEVLYPKVEFPVSTGTPFLSNLVQWAHNEKWSLPLYMSASRKTAASCAFIISTQDDEHKYLRGNIIKGKNVYPFAASLVAAWDTLAMTTGEPKKKLSVSFHDVRLYVQPILNQQQPLKLSVSLHRGTGRFEIMEGKSKVATGLIVAASKLTQITKAHEVDDVTQDEMVFTLKDIYEMLYEREYSYEGTFQNVQASNASLTQAYLEWNNNWVNLIDGMLQLNVLREEHDAVSQPALIQTINIDVAEHSCSNVFSFNEKNVIKASVCNLNNITRCGGITIKTIKFNNLPPSNSQVKLNVLKFVPHFKTDVTDTQTAIQICLQIVAENVNKSDIKVLEISNDPEDRLIADWESNNIPGLKVNHKVISRKDILAEKLEDLNNADLIVVRNLSNNEKVFDGIVKSNTFIISFENKCEVPTIETSTTYHVVSSFNTEDSNLQLIQWKPRPTPLSTRSVTVLNNTDLALLLSKKESLTPDQKLLVVTTYPPIDGMKELISQWRATSRSHIYLVMVNHKIARGQGTVQMPDLNLAFNVLQHGSWGGVYYVPFSKKQSHDMSRNATLQIENVGDLESLHWVEPTESSDETNKIEVHYAGLNTIDAKRATGVVSARNGLEFGMDYSGITSSLEKVMGIANGACKKYVEPIPELTWPVPSHWTLEEAATVPFPYAHAFYCLVLKAEMSPHMSILIHGGAGALGQAAISISLALKLKVFTTVSDIRKKHFLKKIFPELKDDHIGCSRDETFTNMILNHLGGFGADYVLNCIPGKLRQNSIQCANYSGVVVDTTLIPGNEDFIFGMYNLTKARNVVSADFASILAMDNRYDMKKLQLLVSEGIARGYVRPLTHVTFPPTEAARALRLLDASLHRGRVLLRLADTQPPAVPRITCSSDLSHLIVSDEAYYGLQLADRLVDQGAKKLYLNLPKTPSSLFIKKQSWENRGAEVKVTETDFNSIKSVNAMPNDMGPIEGIYFISTDTNKERNEILRAIDAESRNLCPSLKYLAVISTDKDFGSGICISRSQDHLPATKLTIPTIRKSGNSDESSILWRNVLDLLENALTLSEPVIHVNSQTEKKRGLLEEIAAVSDIKIPDNVSGSTTLQDIGCNNQKAEVITILFRDVYNVSLKEEDVLLLSIDQIEEIEQNSRDSRPADVKGLEVFYSHIDPDELMATTEIVFLPTLTSSATMRDDEVDINQTNLCIVPGLEGNFERFRELCSRIKIPALVLQPGLDYPHESIQELADRYAKFLMKRMSSQKPFYLLGYESGVMVALEMASILEDHGLTGTVYCIGASPDEFKKILEEELEEFKTEEALQDAIIRHVYSLMLGSQCDIELGDLPWNEKLERSVRGLLGHVPLSRQYALAQFEAARGRIVRARQHRPAPRPLRSRIILLRARGRNADDTRSSEPLASSELQQYSLQPVTVHDLDLPLAYSLKDQLCASVINRYLHPDILQEFETKNICETYLLDADTFLQAQALND